MKTLAYRIRLSLRIALLSAVGAVLWVGPAVGQSNVLRSALEVHGGLGTWQQQEAVAYDFDYQLGDATRDDRHLLDLRDRTVHISNDQYTVGVTDSTAWVTPSMKAYNYDAAPRFYAKAYSYLFSVPFVFTDADARAEDVGSRTLQGTKYDVAKVTFEPGAGDSPNDVFYVFTDSASGRVHAVLFSVTFRNPDNTSPIVGLVYDEWQTVDGLTVPRAATMYRVSDLQLGRQLADLSFTNVEWHDAPPSDDLFAAPEDAVMNPGAASR